MSKTASATTGVSLTICQQLDGQINAKNGQIKNWKQKLENLLNDTTSSITEILDVKELLSDLDKEILRLQDVQRKNGCSTNPTPESSLDNQTVISTNAVRKKDSATLAIVPMPSPSSTTTPGATTTP